MQGVKIGPHQLLKADKPLELEPIIVEIATPNKSQVVTPDLEDNNKRWLFVGICLHSVLTPVLRQYVTSSMNQMYNKLIQTPNNINKQCYPNILKSHPLDDDYLNYETVNHIHSNRKFGSGKYRDFSKLNYNILNSVDFSKLYFNTNMAQYTGFDDTCDFSALLNIITCSDDLPVRKVAKELRADVRNPWAHCKFSEWETKKYLQSIQKIQQLIRQLHMPTEIQILADLKHWEVNGINFLQGTRLGLEVIEEFKKHTQSLAQYVLQLKDDSSSYSDMVNDSLVLIYNNISNACKRIDQTDRDVSQITIEVSSLRLQTDKIEQTVCKNVKAIKDIKNNIEDMKRYDSDERPNGKVFFYPPDRVAVFVGREDKLSTLEIKFLEHKDVHHIEAICGLGGCGKTTLSIEFAWMFQQFYPGGAFWVSAESKDSLEDTIKTLAIDVNIKGHNSKEIFKRTLTWLARLRERWLLVIDNADTDIISSYLKELMLGTWKRDTRGHFIITTRREPLAVAETFHIDKINCNYLETFSGQEGVQFMIKRTEMFDECSQLATYQS